MYIYIYISIRSKAIMKLYPDKNWKWCTMKSVCRRIDETGSAVVRKPGSGRAKTGPAASNITEVSETLCSQEDQSGTSSSTFASSELANSE